jgi:hypothetical protein
MADYGVKVSNINTDVINSGVGQNFLDSGYSSLMLIDKQTLTFTASAGQTDPSGTVTYTHNLGYSPFVLGYVDYTINGVQPGIKNNAIPYNQEVLLFSSYLESNISMKIDNTKIEINWSVIEALEGEHYPLSYDVVYTITLHIYSYELGSIVP